jgi:hypothetical protein
VAASGLSRGGRSPRIATNARCRPGDSRSRRPYPAAVRVLLLTLTSGAAAQAASSPGDRDPGRLDLRITEITRKPDYPHAQWGLLQPMTSP